MSLIIGNWKMRLSVAASVALAEQLTQSSASGVELVICPSFPSLVPVAAILKGSQVAFGAQDVASKEGGSYTGDVSASMLAEVGCRYVVVGHSERRRNHGEIESVIAEKIAMAVANHLVPILCVGETAEERTTGASSSVVRQQLTALMSAAASTGSLVVAYEPVWAISPHPAASAADATAMLPTLKEGLDAVLGPSWSTRVTILYGGSVDAKNVQGFVGSESFGGVLVGSESLHAESFLAIAAAVAPSA